MPRDDGLPSLWDLPVQALANRAEDAGRSSNAALASAASAMLQARIALEVSVQQEHATGRLVKVTSELESATQALKRATWGVVLVGAAGVVAAFLSLFDLW